MSIHELSAPPILVSDDRARLDAAAIHAYLSRSYWAAGIPRSVVDRSLAASLCFGAYDLDAGGAQVGFARVITDRATFAYLCDVYVLESHRGRGVSSLLMRALMSHPDLQGLRRWMLVTRDAHGLYAKFGFAELQNPAATMEMRDPDVYRRLLESAHPPPLGPSGSRQ